uniref:LITAF domain-containing protein n=1 Tax=Plectus sambesii TaxID=2011161 RepID=A0A914UNP4_9BILA
MEKKMMENNPPPAQIKVTPAPSVNVVVHTETLPTAVIGDIPIQTTCPKCQQHVVTRLNYKAGALTWICVIVILLVFFPLAWAPLCIDSCKDVEHYCPSCGTHIGTKRRL